MANMPPFDALCYAADLLVNNRAAFEEHVARIHAGAALVSTSATPTAPAPAAGPTSAAVLPSQAAPAPTSAPVPDARSTLAAALTSVPAPDAAPVRRPLPGHSAAPTQAASSSSGSSRGASTAPAASAAPATSTWGTKRETSPGDKTAAEKKRAKVIKATGVKQKEPCKRCRGRQLIIDTGKGTSCKSDEFLPCTREPGKTACARCKFIKEKCEP
ncbi:hypothetical protein QBC34DRAFT_475155 [Podospora aff. communis PSN243]|uniref:Zn(2)-C6 fungal-type domain-containing protein n=1 Tax=Podospora aff. communis PSN243 TaxID=3040156 RepID=A0AAV9GA48_9PEZI|nr:hypothetical protein QBC34DRAFT_475155 [Podospora aff. communis PSN243]